MAKKIYFIVMDTTKDREDPSQMNFYETRALNDISGNLVLVAKMHKTHIEKMRLFVAPDKKTWERMRDEFVSRVDYGDII